LKHHADAAFIGRFPRDIARLKEDSTAVGLFESGDHSQDGGFPAAGWTEQCEELTIFDLHVHGINDGSRTLEGLGESFQCENAYFPDFPLMFWAQ
jgi:hypothetical protein